MLILERVTEADSQHSTAGSVWKNAYVERPQVVQDKAGNPLALFLGMSKLDGYGDSVRWNAMKLTPNGNYSFLLLSDF